MSKIFKRENGVTLIALIITIVVLFIIVGISVRYGLSSINDVTDETSETELYMVQQAIAQQYTFLLSKYESKKIATTISSDTLLEDDSDRPETLVGTRIASISTLSEYGFTEYINDYSDTSLYYEDYYYFLDSDDLKTLGVDSESSSSGSSSVEYIVNYSTGEVFDVISKNYIALNNNDSNEEPEYDFSDN